MYGNHNNNREIYAKIVQNEQHPVLASLVERSLKQEVDWGEKQKLQQSWSVRVNEAIQSVADVNPYLPAVADGQGVPAVQAVASLSTTAVLSVTAVTPAAVLCAHV